ncbi:hypothetical protein AB0F17_25770 [Nonomuraea sp. NPDC026600]|uniref:hypothetical protein n=1 Tax=Nonomuraea sp. NPDC026600 TaxID=3155363 RepID=UPI0033FF59FB
MTQTLRRAAVWPVLSLMVISPVLAEVISSATPVVALLNPALLLSYVLILYGLPVLIIREVAVRRRVGPLGLWCLGLIYGLYNEGLLSLDLFHPFGHSGDGYAGYGVVGGLLVPFTIFIAFWHGLFSVALPVLLVERLFPKQAGRAWLPTWLVVTIAALCLVMAVLAYFGVGRDTPQPVSDAHLAVVMIVGLALWFCAGWLPRTPVLGPGRPKAPVRSFVVGALLFAAILTPSILADEGVAWGWQPSYFAIVAIAAAWAIGRVPVTSHATAVICVMGAGAAHAVATASFGVMGGDPLLVASAAVLGAAFVVVAVRSRTGYGQ